MLDGEPLFNAARVMNDPDHDVERSRTKDKPRVRWYGIGLAKENHFFKPLIDEQQIELAGLVRLQVALPVVGLMRPLENQGFRDAIASADLNNMLEYSLASSQATRTGVCDLKMVETGHLPLNDLEGF